MPTNVLITGALHESAISAFKANKNLAMTYRPDCERAELLKLLPSAHVLVTRSETDVDKAVIDAATELKIIARAAVGVGNIDIDYATGKGVLVINCPGKNTNSAAELTLGLMLAMFRKIPNAHGHLKGGGWDRHRFSGRELRGKRLGIVGLGNVGHRVAKFAHGFDMEVSAYDPYISPDVFQRYGVINAGSLMDLAANVDVLTVHVPLNKETKGMVDAKVLSAMPAGGYIVNAARGGVCKESDLVAALASGHLAGVALDTFDNEPKPLPALLNHERVWCTPHIGASTEEAQVSIGKTVYEQVVKALDGGVVDYPVNLPDIGVPDNALLKAYSILAQKLGSVIGQIIDFNPKRMEIHYRGDLAGLDTKLVRVSLMKGYASHVVDQYVSFVNTVSHFEKLGIVLTETSDPDFSSYKSAIKVVVLGDRNESLSVGGIVFDGVYPRISLINDFYFEIDPSGYLILMENNDQPGVIGDVGHFLASKNINIDNFSLSRNKRGGKAMAVIRTDSNATTAQAAEMAALKNVTSVKLLSL